MTDKMTATRAPREGHDLWDKVCAIPSYGFIHSEDNSRVLKAKGIGNWIDRDDVLAIVDQAQLELNRLRAAISAPRVPRVPDEATRSNAPCELDIKESLAWAEGWNACRESMLSAAPDPADSSGEYPALVR